MLNRLSIMPSRLRQIIFSSMSVSVARLKNDGAADTLLRSKRQEIHVFALAIVQLMFYRSGITKLRGLKLHVGDSIRPGIDPLKLLYNNSIILVAFELSNIFVDYLLTEPER